MKNVRVGAALGIHVFRVSNVKRRKARLAYLIMNALAKTANRVYACVIRF